MTQELRLAKRLAASLDVAARSIPILGHRADISDANRQAFRREKFICETAILVYAAFQATEHASSLRRRCLEVAKLVEPIARGDEILSLMCLRPNMISELSVAHACLSAIGFIDTRFDDRIRKILVHGYRAPERAPWKDIEAHWIASKCQHLQSPDWWQQSAARTTLATGLDVLTSRREDLYAFTHAAIYITDFGNETNCTLRNLLDILADAEGALARSIDDDDFDLCAELIMMWPYFGASLDSTPRFCLTVMEAIEDDIGFLPSLSIRTSELAGLAPEVRKYRVLDEAYHTVYVMGLLCASLMRRPIPNEAHPVLRPAEPARIRELLLPKSQTPQWEVAFDSAQSDTKSGLSSFLASIALRRALIANDLNLVRRILIVCSDSGLAMNSAMFNATKIILRLAETWRIRDA